MSSGNSYVNSRSGIICAIIVLLVSSTSDGEIVTNCINSACTLSGANKSKSVLVSSIAANVIGSKVNPYLALRRTPRKIRSASSFILSTGFPTQRIIFLSKSVAPSYGSINPTL